MKEQSTRRARRKLLRIGWLLLCWIGPSGCALNRPAISTAPTLFAKAPTLEQALQAINEHSGRVQQLHADNVRLSVPGQFGSLDATLDFDRPNRFRMSGETRMTGPEIDLGSNDEIFWLWVTAESTTHRLLWSTRSILPKRRAAVSADATKLDDRSPRAGAIGPAWLAPALSL